MFAFLQQLPFPRNESRQFQNISALKPGVDFTPGFIRPSPSTKVLSNARDVKL